MKPVTKALLQGAGAQLALQAGVSGAGYLIGGAPGAAIGGLAASFASVVAGIKGSQEASAPPNITRDTYVRDVGRHVGLAAAGTSSFIGTIAILMLR